jgi:hypothetical protein
MVDALTQLLGSFVVRLLFYLILFPLSWLLLTPVILLGAAFTRDPYLESVRNGYRNVTEFLSDVMLWI